MAKDEYVWYILVRSNVLYEKGKLPERAGRKAVSLTA